MPLAQLFSELNQRLLDSLRDRLSIWLVAAAVAVGLCMPQVRRLSLRVRRPLRVFLLAVAVAGAVVWAWSLLWASDDAYISFRYAYNLVQGHGLVYNPGERVEGYTDFLWTLIAAFAIWLKGDPGQVSIVVNLASFAGVVWLVERLGRRLQPAPILIGIAVPLVAASYTMASFGTACIETMFAALLVLVSLERLDAGHPLVAGLAGIAATLTHPDHGIFYAVLGLALLLDKSRRKDLLYYAIPFVVVFVPYYLWRWSYYGDLMPNTYYAKSANKAYFEQGNRYVMITFVGSGFWLSLPLLLLGAMVRRKTLIGRYALLIVPIYLTYVAKVGGDFMLGRFFVPIIPIWLLLVDAGFRWLMAKNHWRTAMGGALLATVIAAAPGVIKSGEIFEGVADERTYGGVGSFASMNINAWGYNQGRFLYRNFTQRGFAPKVATWCIGALGYESRLPIFDMRGLTNRSVAHLPIEHRGRPGHEKNASPGLIVASGSDLSETPIYPSPYERVTSLQLGGGRYYLMRYDAKLISELPAQSQPATFASYLDGQATALVQKPAHIAACDLWLAREYYFSVNHDPGRQARLAQAAAEGDPTLQGIESLLLETPDLSELGYKPIRRFSFDANEVTWTAEGQAGRWITDALRPEQEYPFGARGRFVNSFLTPENEAPTGRLISPEFQLQGDVVTFLIGGGQSPNDLRLQLIVQRPTGATRHRLQQRLAGTTRLERDAIQRQDGPLRD